MTTVHLTPGDGHPQRVTNAINKNADAIDNLTAAEVAFAPAGGIAATDVQAALAELDTEKANLASPTFTGNPAAPTPAPGDNDTSIATTAFVTAAVAAGAGTPVVRLAQGTVTAAATLDIPLTAYTAYRSIIIQLQGLIPVDDATALWMRFSTDGGSNYDVLTYAYVSRQTDSGAGASTVSSNSAAQIVVNNDVGNGSAEGVDAEITLMEQTSTARWTKAGFSSHSIDSTGTPRLNTLYGAGTQRTAQDTDAVRFLFSTGNIASGKYVVIGVP